jgi:magnesium chelatase subunit D
MNEEEGELRPQIADRIGLRVEVEAVVEPEARGEIVRRREAFTADAEAFSAGWIAAQSELAESVAAAGQLLPAVRVPEHLYPAVGQLTVKAGVSSHRADVTIVECAKAAAALAGRGEVAVEDVVEAAALALGHRLPVDPFAPPPSLEPAMVRRLLDEALDLERSKKVEANPVP